uniref:Pre-rRNA-processing protein TSR2 homolog n=1 Tax=Picocystis salinarum TaxID=88271 RepID=A0A7S3UA35_9CHLO|eukprot:CAMPEP_0113923060 /NCGR_PEP_ID=MMETSP1159-20121227/1944_1 /TAXON_ID=88271 /ORGANISM="Picocystis salinarum" /LENGTH=211 /DNA_ID=CAMNT_0000923209 /DNA_START=37 /DNA_END=672 /DNA_ORIENTATION=+ /assembly_acc=CAM_ASM_000767
MELRSGAKLWNELRGEQPKLNHEEQKQAFLEGVGLILQRWTALGLAIEHGWGGTDTTAKAQSFHDEVYHWFVDAKEQRYVDELEDLLDDIMAQEFNAELQDGSPRQVAEALVRLFEECAQGNYSTVLRLREVMVQQKDIVASKSFRIDESGKPYAGGGGNVPSLVPMGEPSTNQVDFDTSHQMDEDTKSSGPDPDEWEVVKNNRKKGKGKK